MDRVRAGPILEVNAALREDGLNRFHELVDKRIELLSRRASPPHTQVQRIVKILLVVSPRVEIHGQQILGRHSRASGVQLQLPDRDSHPVRSKVAKAENPPGVGNTDEPYIFLGPVLQHVFYLAPACHREIHAAWAPIDMPEFQASLADRRVVNDRQKLCGVRHDGPVKQGFIVV